MSFSVCPHITSAYGNLMVSGSTKTIDCSVAPYKFFDQIILEEYEKGCRVFFCEIGRGKDGFSDSHYKLCLAAQDSEQSSCKKQLLSTESDNMNGKFCIINFGVTSRDPPHLNDNKCIRTNFKFDNYFVDEFKKWFTEFIKTHYVYIEFIDMTIGNINESKELMNIFITPFSLKIGTLNYLVFSSYLFTKSLACINK